MTTFQLTQDQTTLIVRVTGRAGWVEVRGGASFVTDPPRDDPFARVMDALSAPTVAQLFAGDIAQVNPKNPRTAPDLDVARALFDLNP